MTEVTSCLAPAVRLVCEDFGSVDLYEVSVALQRAFPGHSIVELSRMVAEIAILEGCRHLVWDPPEGWENGRESAAPRARNAMTENRMS